MIGKLQISDYKITKSNLMPLPTAKVEGNPFKGEKLVFPYNDLVLSGIDINFTTIGLLSAVEISLGDNFTPTQIQLKDGSGKILSSYVAETNKVITEKLITLTADAESENLTLTFDSNYSDVEINNITLYGASGEDFLFPTPYQFNNSNVFIDIPSSLNEVFAPETEGYTIKIDENEILIKYSEPLYLNMAKSRIEHLKKGNKILKCAIIDKPFCTFRGVHLYMPAMEDIGFFKNLVKYILVPCGYNHIILEICGSMEFESHPEINEAYVLAQENYQNGIWPKLPHGSVASGTIIPKKTVKELCLFCRNLGIEVIPEIQSLGHVQFMTLAHPEIAEIPVDKKTEFVDERLADVPPDEFYAHSFCPSNEKSYEILFDLMEEIIDTFEPKEYVHMGHDEVYQIGVCPVCSKLDPADIYYNDIMKLYNFLKKKNLKMMIWADMINCASAYKTVPAVDRIPKDIVLLDFIWYFHTDKDIENNLLSKGFNVIIGNLYSSYFPRYEKRIRTEGIWGGEISAWVKSNEASLQKEGKLYDIIYTAQMLWNENYLENCRFAYDKIIRNLIPQMRNKIQGTKEFNKTEPLFNGKTQNLKIEVNGTFEALTFTHATEFLISKTPWGECENLGAYTVRYEDGTSEEIPLNNGFNIYFKGVRQNSPIKNGYYRHTGYVATWATDEVLSENSTYYKYTWFNPHKNAKIVEITLNSITPITTILVEGKN